MLQYKIEKSNSCPFCGKHIPYRRKIMHHGDLLEAQGCPHCGHKLRIKYLLVHDIFYATIFGLSLLFYVYNPTLNVPFLIFLFVECLLYTISMLLLPFVPEDEDELQAYQASDLSPSGTPSSIQDSAEPDMTQSPHE